MASTVGPGRLSVCTPPLSKSVSPRLIDEHDVDEPHRSTDIAVSSGQSANTTSASNQDLKSCLKGRNTDFPLFLNSLPESDPNFVAESERMMR